MNTVIPLCLGRSLSVRHTAIPHSENWAPELQTFWPLRIHSSPSLSALVATLARSEPLRVLRTIDSTFLAHSPSCLPNLSFVAQFQVDGLMEPSGVWSLWVSCPPGVSYSLSSFKMLFVLFGESHSSEFRLPCYFVVSTSAFLWVHFIASVIITFLLNDRL